MWDAHLFKSLKESITPFWSETNQIHCFTRRKFIYKIISEQLFFKMF